MSDPLGIDVAYPQGPDYDWRQWQGKISFGMCTVADRARTFLNTANGLAPDHRVLVYTNPGFAQIGACAGLNLWFLWVADYGVSSPAVPQPWSHWTFWQNGDTPVDTDRFNGTEAELLRFTRMPKSR